MSRVILDEQPELEGVVDVPVMLDLGARGWRWVPCGGHIKIGNVTLLHGDQIGGGINVAKKLVDSIHGAAVMGHAHRPSMYTATSLTTATDKWSGYTIPVSARWNRLCEGPANAFCTGFGILEQGSTCINVHNVVITNGTFNWGRRRV